MFHLAIKSIGFLAKGLRENFKEGAKSLVSGCLKKFAEKRPQIIEDLKTTLVSMLNSTNLMEISESVLASF